jgi:hypothetical protein
MTSEDIFKESFPQYTQVGGNHYTKFPIQPYEFISKNDLSFFQGNVIKYVCRYQRKGGIEDLKKIVKEKMTASFGIGMFLYSMLCLFIGAGIVYYFIKDL